MSPSDVERIGQAFWIIRADVEQNRKRRLRVQTAAPCVKREFADRDPHSARALITQPQNPLAICHDDCFDAVEVRAAQDIRDALLMRNAQKKSTGLAKTLAEVLTSETHRRGVDDRQHLFEMTNQQRIKEHFVCVLEAAQEKIPLEVIRQLTKCLQTARYLFVERSHCGRQ